MNTMYKLLQELFVLSNGALPKFYNNKYVSMVMSDFRAYGNHSLRWSVPRWIIKVLN